MCQTIVSNKFSLFFILNHGSNLDRIQKPLRKKWEKISKVLSMLKGSCWILFHTAQELHFILQPVFQGFRSLLRDI